MKNFNEWLSTKVVKPMGHIGDPGVPVESDTVLEIGDMVRIKDKEWFDSLEKGGCEDRIVSVDKKGVKMYFGNYSMKKFLGCEATIKRICDKSEYYGDFYPVYRLELPDKKNNSIESYFFTNEMLEYI